jgi:hypothetical protein
LGIQLANSVICLLRSRLPPLGTFLDDRLTVCVFEINARKRCPFWDGLKVIFLLCIRGLRSL